LADYVEIYRGWHTMLRSIEVGRLCWDL